MLYCLAKYEYYSASYVDQIEYEYNIP